MSEKITITSENNLTKRKIIGKGEIEIFEGDYSGHISFNLHVGEKNIMHTLATDEFDTPDQVKQDLQTQLDELTEKTDEKLSALIDAMSLTDELIIKAAGTKINKN